MDLNRRNSATYPAGQSKKRALTTAGVIVLVIAAAAPLAAMIGNTPLAFETGAGLSMPAGFVLVGLTLLCFAFGYTALSREIVSKGAFYTQVGQGLGRPAGVIAAYAAALAYCAYSLGMAAAFGYFTSLLTKELGYELPWMGCAAFGILTVAFLGYRSLDLSARVLTYFMIAEFSVLLVFDVLVLSKLGLSALPLDVWSASQVFNPSIGAIIPFVIVSFLGFEAAALYGEETKNPRRSIPVATYISLAVVVAFYMVSVWIIIGSIGTNEVQPLAARESGNLLFALSNRYGGEVLTAVMGLLLVASMLASFLAVHNAASRYLFALASDHLLPSALANFHPNFHSPHVASVFMTSLQLIVVFGLGMYGVSPYLGIASSMIGLGTIGILAMQIACSLAVVGFFVKAKRGNRVTTRVLPTIGALGLTVCLVLVVNSYQKLTGSDNPLINGLPWVFLPLSLFALVYARWLKINRPNVYAQIAGAQYRPVSERLAVETNYENHYCIIGAGPSGLVMARAFIKEGVPFDCFERHSDVGGLWDPQNPGTPIYESAHFISSKWTSYFYGFPMPDHFPDYPSYKQILDYIRSFARAFGLYDYITFNVEVVSAVPVDGKWKVMLSTGEIRTYAGVVACPGVTWHASIPRIPGADSFKGEIRHSVSYMKPEEFTGKRVLVVGAGNSGVDIACDAAKFADKAFFSVRRGYRFVPKHLFGIPTDVLMSGQVLPPKGVAVSTDVGKMLDTLNGDLTRLGLPKPDHDALSSHPIMNTQILHYLGHGDLIAKPDIKELRGNSVIFKDGSEEEVDLIMLATGYEYKMPFFDPAMFEWKDGRPQLYMNVIHRSERGLYVLGFTEFADAAYRRFDEMAQLIIADVHATETNVARAWLDEQRRTHFPDLRGGKVYIDSPRHANYVHTDTYKRLMAEFRRKLGWPDLDDGSYADLRRPEDGVHRQRGSQKTFTVQSADKQHSTLEAGQ
ncbi:amino acid permease [Rhizobium sp. AG855]|uniref:amino acid permease n=1 Tax=Rhizobium sp. AG855 TaxID=2183898 RepID=UPI000E756046|nr:amino acid permease [Rhizobium sp. AG855]RKE77429.1 amino acid transporter [Rhizobium sp. AG855]